MSEGITALYLLVQAANPLLKPTPTYHMQKEKCGGWFINVPRLAQLFMQW